MTPVGSALTARRVRRADREAVVAHLARDPLHNLFLLDLALRHGGEPSAGELRTELASLVEKQPEDVAALLRGWLVERR